MYTQCPECLTVFRVTAEDLRLAGGRVRCGHCTAVFSALGHLFERSDPGQTNSDQHDPAGDRSEPADIPAALDDDIGYAIEELNLAEFDLESASMADDPEQMIDQLARALEAGKRVASGSGSLEFDAPEEQWGEVFGNASTSRRETIRDDEAADSVVDADALLPADLKPGTESGDSTRDKPAAPDRRRTWGLASLALVLTLFGQWVHYHRYDLIAQPSIGPAVKRAYASIGLNLRPLGIVTDYDIEYRNAIGMAGEIPELTVRTSLINRMPRLKPLPLIRLVLEDRWGDRVGMRIFEPHEYLPDSATDPSFLEPNARIRTVINVVDPGPDAVGFKLDVCLRNDSGTIICAEDFAQDGTLIGSTF